jgi:hypothetical protein
MQLAHHLPMLDGGNVSQQKLFSPALNSLGPGVKETAIKVLEG